MPEVTLIGKAEWVVSPDPRADHYRVFIGFDGAVPTDESDALPKSTTSFEFTAVEGSTYELYVKTFDATESPLSKKSASVTGTVAVVVGEAELSPVTGLKVSFSK